MADPVVVDTNVLAVAEGLNDEASLECVAACIRLARRIQEGQICVVVDEDGEILSEYLRNVGGGHSGLGVKLARRFRQRRHMACRQVSITPLHEPVGSFEEVPEPLRDFDDDDQKFLAVAKAGAGAPQIYVALDQEWWCRRADLVAAGFDIQFLCSDDLLDVECP